MTRKRWLIIATTLATIIVLPIAWYLGSPLFINRTVDEAFPVVQAALASQADGSSMAVDATGVAMSDQVTATSMEQTVMSTTEQPMESLPPPTATKAPTSEPTPTPVPTRKPALTATPAPTVEPSPTEIPPTPVPSEPVALKSGQFHPVEHRGAGKATIYQLTDGRRILRFENFDVLNGPDLYVYLSGAEDANDEATILNSGYISLGRLKGNQGNQNYEIPPDLDLDTYRSVSIWCQRFSVNFATAPLR